jgi:hypothetical protein
LVTPASGCRVIQTKLAPGPVGPGGVSSPYAGPTHVDARRTESLKKVGSVRYQTDYVLRLIEELGAMVRVALEKLGLKQPEEPHDLAATAIGLALSLDPAYASSLSPQSLRSLFQLGGVDDRIVSLVKQAIEVEASSLERQGDVETARFRYEQAHALQSLLEASPEPG